MQINNVHIGADLLDILNELQSQMRLNDLPYIKNIKDGPDNVQITCPYHNDGQERKPSMGISKKTGICHCFACSKVVDLQELISHCFGHEDILGTFGFNWILKNFATISVEERKDVELCFSRSNSATDDNSSNHNFITEEELDSYRYTHPYMYKRKLTDEIIELFDVGYDANSQCITFPVRDVNGNTLFVARRSVKTKFFNYPQGAEKPVYGLYEIMSMKTGKFKELFPNEFVGNELIICESMLDALTCWVYGKPAVALNGLGNELQFKQLNAMPFRKFILATDMDEAGRKARARIKKNLHHKLVTEYVWDVNIAKDINDMSKEYFEQLQEVF